MKVRYEAAPGAVPTPRAVSNLAFQIPSAVLMSYVLGYILQGLLEIEFRLDELDSGVGR